MRNSIRVSYILGDGLSFMPLFQKTICKLQIRNLCLRIPQTVWLYRHKQWCMRPVSYSSAAILIPHLRYAPCLIIFLICPLFAFLRFHYSHCFRDFLSFYQVFLSFLSTYLHSFAFLSNIFRLFPYVFNFQFFFHVSLISHSIHSSCLLYFFTLLYPFFFNRSCVLLIISLS